MAFKLSVWLLVLVVSGGCFMSTASPLGAETTREDIDIVVNGEMVHERRETDGTCRHAKNTATLADGSSSTSYEDMDSGLVLVQISNDTDTCYVKEISQDEKDEAKTCKDGTVSRSEDKPDLEEEDLVDGPEVPAERLSPQLRDLCAGKKIVSMVPAANSDSDDGAGLSRKKRGCYFRIRLYRYYICRRSCFFFFCWRRCYGPYYTWIRFRYCN